MDAGCPGRGRKNAEKRADGQPTGHLTERNAVRNRGRSRAKPGTGTGAKTRTKSRPWRPPAGALRRHRAKSEYPYTRENRFFVFQKRKKYW